MAKIVRAEFKNYRALRDVAISLGDLTVLVGPNACGKSSVLAGLVRRVTSADRTAEAKDIARVDLKFENGKSATRHENDGGNRGTGEVFQFDLSAMRKPNLVAQAESLDAAGGNLVNAFVTLGRRDQENLVEEFTRMVPVFGDVDTRPLGSGNHRLVFRDRWITSRYYEPAEVSDGSLLVLAYLVLHYQRKAVQLACIEEPERGLHPWLLAKVIDLLRKMSLGEVGDRRTQVVIATQSSDLLNHVKPEEVRFFARDPATGDVTITNAPTDRPDWEHALDSYENSLGALWLSGSVGGVPAE